MNEHQNGTRYWLIEMHAYWEGLVNTRHLIEFFKVSRNQAQKYITDYKTAHPNNIKYNSSLKGFCACGGFKPNYITGDANEYLEWLHTSTPNAQFTHHTPLTNASLNLPQRFVHPKVMQGLTQAIRLRKRIDVDYVSLKNPDGDGRVIQPHVFVKTGLRWHLRAFDEKHQQFRDFVLSRFSGAPELLDGDSVNPNTDTAWNTFIDVKLIADLRLSEPQKRVIEKDYQMHNGELVISTRAALAQYVLQEIHVNIKFVDEHPEAQQLVLANKQDIKKWLFNI